MKKNPVDVKRRWAAREVSEQEKEEAEFIQVSPFDLEKNVSVSR